MSNFNAKQIPKVIQCLKLIKEDYGHSLVAFYPKDLVRFYDCWHFFVDDMDFYFSDERKIIDAAITESLDFKVVFCFLDFRKLNKEKHARIKIDLNDKNSSR